MANVENKAENAANRAKEALNQSVVPTPPNFHEQASIHELKTRLDWGEPGLTILDVRSPQAFGQRRILGAASAPIDGLRQYVDLKVEFDRDLYVYGETDAETAEAAQKLRQNGFQRVAELQGGLTAWEKAGGSIEGTAVSDDPVSPGSFNVVNRMQEFASERRNER